MKYILLVLGFIGLVLVYLVERNNLLTAKAMFYYLLSFMAIIESIALDVVEEIKDNKTK